MAGALVARGILVGGAVAALVVAGCVSVAGGSPGGGSGHGIVPRSLEHPDPKLYAITLNYETPLTYADGATAIMPPLERRAARAALKDALFLRYLLRSDLGGFEPAPIGEFITTVKGRAVTRAPKRSQVPFLTAVGKKITVFGYVTGNKTPRTPTLPPVTPTTFTPPPTTHPRTPARTGFRTTPGFPTPVSTTTTIPHRRTHPTTTTTTRPSHPTTTTTTVPPTSSTTTTTTTAPPPTTTTTVPHRTPPPTTPPTTPGFIRMCNDKGTLPIIDVTNQKPGDSASDDVTLANCGTVRFELSLASVGRSVNTLTRELDLKVTKVSNGHVVYDGPLTSAGTSPIGYLTPGQTEEFEVTLYLPLTAGNDVQNETAIVDLYWNGVGT